MCVNGPSDSNRRPCLKPNVPHIIRPLYFNHPSCGGLASLCKSYPLNVISDSSTLRARRSRWQKFLYSFSLCYRCIRLWNCTVCPFFSLPPSDACGTTRMSINGFYYNDCDREHIFYGAKCVNIFVFNTTSTAVYNALSFSMATYMSWSFIPSSLTNAI